MTRRRTLAIVSGSLIAALTAITATVAMTKPGSTGPTDAAAAPLSVSKARDQGLIPDSVARDVDLSTARGITTPGGHVYLSGVGRKGATIGPASIAGQMCVVQVMPHSDAAQIGCNPPKFAAEGAALAWHDPNGTINGVVVLPDGTRDTAVEGISATAVNGFLAYTLTKGQKAHITAQTPTGPITIPLG